MLSQETASYAPNIEPNGTVPRPTDMRETKTNEVEDGLEALLPRLWRFAITLTKNGTQAEDLVQDTCVRVLDRAHLFRPGTHLDRWCFTVMANLFRSDLRKKRPELVSDEVLNAYGDQSPNPEGSFFSRQVLEAVDALPEAQRALVVLVYGEGLTYREAAEVLDVPIGTVMSRLHAARGKLAHLNR